MLSLRHKLPVGQLLARSSCSTYIFHKHDSSIRVYEHATGLLEQVCYVSGVHEEDIINMTIGGTKLLLYSSVGTLHFFDLDKYCSSIGTIALKNAFHTLEPIICASREGVFFLTAPNSTSLRSVVVTAQDTHITPVLRLDSMSERGKPIVRMCCHPSNPYLIVQCSKGSVQVWSYAKLARQLLGDEGSAMLDDESVDDDDNKHHHRSSSGGDLFLLPVALLCPPLSHKNHTIPLHVAISASNHASVIWSSGSTNGDVICVYDMRAMKISVSNGDTPRITSCATHVSASATNRLLDVCFHMFEPLLFVHYLYNYKHYITALSLLDSSLPALMTCCVGDTGNGISDMQCDIGTSHLLLSSVTDVTVYELTQFFRNKCCVCHPVVSRLCAPAAVYISDGDAALSHTVGNAVMWPLLLTVQTDITYQSNGTKSQCVAASRLFKMPLALTSQDKQLPVYLGDLPSIITKANSTFLAHCPPPPLGAIFIPCRVTTNPYLYCGVYDNNNFDALISGSCFITAKPDAGSSDWSSEISIQSAVCFASYSKNTLSTQFIDAADAMYWCPNSATVSHSQLTQILVLDSSLQRLKLCAVGESASMFAAASPVVFDLPFRLQSIHSPTINGINRLVAVTVAEKDATAALVISSPGTVDIDAQSPRYELSPQESVIEVLWQPHSDSAANIGVLTDKRVLILNQNLELLAQVCPKSRVCSLTWICSALCYAQENGSVHYLLPRNVIYDSPHSQRQEMHQLMAKAMAVNLYDDMQTGILCSLSRHASETQCLVLVGCLPDRLIYATYTCLSLKTSWKLNYCVRPIVPVEPVLLSILLGNLSVEKRRPLLLQLATQYFGAKPLVGSDTTAVPSTHSTSKVCLALTLCHHEDIALIAAGITTNPMEGTGADFVRHRWLTPAVKFILCLRAGKIAEACNELMSSRPELQELFLDPESFGGGTLPHRESAVAKYYLFAARVVASMGSVDYARRLADIAGNDEYLALLLQLQNRTNDLQSLADAMLGRSGNFHRVLSQLLNNDTDANRCKYVPMNGIGSCDRRATLLPVSPLTDNAPSVYKGDNIDLLQIERSQRSHISARGGGIGTLTKLGILALDLIDDYGIKSYPESLQLNESAVKRTDHHTDSSDVPAGLKSLPSTWIEDVGVGKEWDRVSAYLRFSDIFRPGDEEFVSSVIAPPAQINILDLSKYANNFEVYFDSPQRISFEPSTSPVDPGDAHDKVKSVYDLIFHESPPIQEPGHVGIRCVSGRGGPLDIGMFHEDAHRSKLTIEMFVYRIEGSKQTASPHRLIRRCIGKPQEGVTHNNQASIWSLDVDTSGSLVFACGKQRVATDAGAVNMGPTPDVSVSVWTHLAVVLDTHANICNVTMFINGSMSTSGSIEVPAISEEDLAYSTWYLFPDLSGWRVTEVRLWSDARGSADIENSKDNYLPLASKRKRLQFRIKGSKKLFGPLPNFDITYNPAPASCSGSVSGQQLSKKELSTSLPAPLTSANRAKKGLTPPTGGGLLKPPSSGGSLLQPPKRSSLPADALSSVTAGVSSEPTADENDNSTAAKPIPLATPSADGGAAGGLLRPPTSGAKRPQRRSSLASHTLPSSLSQFQAPIGSDASDTTPHNLVTTYGNISSVEIAVSDVAKCIRRRLIVSSQRILGFATAVRIPPVETEIAVCEAVTGKLLKTSVPISCESVIMSPSSAIIAYYANKNILVIEKSSQNKIVEQIMSIPLVFWCFENETKILFVTHQYIYSWNAVSGAAPPVKLFSRIDVSDAAKWADRKVLDLQVCGEWVMIVSCLRLSAATSNSPANYEEALGSALVSFYHLSSPQRHFQVLGCCGCFLSVDQCCVYVGSASGLEDKMYVLNLNLTPSTADTITLLPSLPYVCRHRNISITQKRSSPPHPILLQGTSISAVVDDSVKAYHVSDEPILSSAVIFLENGEKVLQAVTATTGKFLTVDLSQLL